MRKWKRVEGADGPRFRSSLASHEAALLRNLVTSMLGMLDDRESSSPADELEEITGMRTGHSQPPPDDTMKRLLPDFYRAQTDHPAGLYGARVEVTQVDERLPSLQARFTPPR